MFLGGLVLLEFFFWLLGMEPTERISEELVAHGFFDHGCKYLLVTGSDEGGKKISLGIITYYINQNIDKGRQAYLIFRHYYVWLCWFLG